MAAAGVARVIKTIDGKRKQQYATAPKGWCVAVKIGTQLSFMACDNALEAEARGRIWAVKYSSTYVLFDGFKWMEGGYCSRSIAGKPKPTAVIEADVAEEVLVEEEFATL